MLTIGPTGPVTSRPGGPGDPALPGGPGIRASDGNLSKNLTMGLLSSKISAVAHHEFIS